jgi:putative transposase
VSRDNQRVEYIHLNPVRAGVVKRAEEWRWSSVHDYTGGLSAGVSAHGVLASDCVPLRADDGARI